MITRFTGEYFFLSNFYPCRIRAFGWVYENAEAAYQAAKCIRPEDQFLFVGLDGPGAKKQGDKVLRRPDWNQVKFTIMARVVRAKFSEDPLKSQLLSTEDQTLLEGNYWHDNIWGSCTCSRCGDQGANNLGKILMQIRSELQGG